MKQKVLSVCVHNSARSQMSEEYLRKFAADRFEVESAGIEPGAINPLVAAAELCPVFPDVEPTRRLHWAFDDPSQVTGTREQKLAKVREIRDEVRAKILEFVAEQRSD
jgi:arsenate reductase